MKTNLKGEVELVVNKLNEDWKVIFDYFEPMMKLLYKVGKEEKIEATLPEERVGIVTGN